MEMRIGMREVRGRMGKVREKVKKIIKGEKGKEVKENGGNVRERENR